MNEEQFNNLMNRSRWGHTTVVLDAVDAEAGLIKRAAYNGLTLLHEASSSGHVELIQGLIDRKADIHAKAAVGCDALMISAGNGHIEALKLLFTAGADMTATDNNNCNALIIAAMTNHLDCAVFLLSRGCDLRLVNDRGESALDLCRSDGNRLECAGDVGEPKSHEFHAALFNCAQHKVPLLVH